MTRIIPRRTARFRPHPVFGLAASFVIHVGLVACLLVVSFRPSWCDARADRQQRSIRITQVDGRIAADRVHAEPSTVRWVASTSEVTGPMVRQRVDEAVRRAETTDDAETLQRLDQLTHRLNAASTAESVDAMAGVLSSLLGTSPRADRPAEEPVGGGFDFHTAQFHDIRRLAAADGGIAYVTVLLDAEGRTIETPVDAATGERVYLTLQRIKANPLLDQIYRRIVMPLIDQMLADIRSSQTSGQRGATARLSTILTASEERPAAGPAVPAGARPSPCE